MATPDLYEQPAPTIADHRARLVALVANHPADLRSAVAVVLAELDDMAEALARVRQMRRAQREYFRTKGGLPICKALESKVDGLLKRWE